MGQYINTVLMHTLIVSKEDLKDNNISKEELEVVLNNEMDLSIFDKVEDDENYIFNINKEIFTPEIIAEFLKEQCLLFESEQTEEIYNEISRLSSYNEVIKFSKDKPYENFQDFNTKISIRVNYFKRITVYIEGILFFIEGKAYLECYSTFFKYIKKLIVNSSDFEISKAVEIFLD